MFMGEKQYANEWTVSQNYNIFITEVFSDKSSKLPILPLWKITNPAKAFLCSQCFLFSPSLSLSNTHTQHTKKILKKNLVLSICQGQGSSIQWIRQKFQFLFFCVLGQKYPPKNSWHTPLSSTDIDNNVLVKQLELKVYSLTSLLPVVFNIRSAQE